MPFGIARAADAKIPRRLDLFDGLLHLLHLGHFPLIGVQLRLLGLHVQPIAGDLIVDGDEDQLTVARHQHHHDQHQQQDLFPSCQFPVHLSASSALRRVMRTVKSRMVETLPSSVEARFSSTLLTMGDCWITSNIREI